MVSLVTSFTSLGPSALAYCVASSAIHVVVGSVFFDLVHWLAHRSGRRITVTGARGTLGHALADALGREKGASVQTARFGLDWTYDDYSRLDPLLRATDILVLAHGAKGPDAQRANCDSAVAIIEAFRRVRAQVPSSSLLRPEVWYVGSEAELHGAWTEDMRAHTSSKRAFARFARAYCDDDDFTYRHVVPAAFSSAMGPALVSARWAAVVALWWIRRGARYVPVTYTGLAFLNFFSILFLGQAGGGGEA
ncbi:hypothetical protein VDGD_07415 [Verticillium dahliae]|nr:hypothetical protein VDGD_07415 [Verticillium dahliae]